MSWQTTLTAMLPEHLLLAGIVLLVLAPMLRVKGGAITTLALLAVLASAFAATVLHLNGYDVAAFPGQFSVTPAGSLAKAIVLALAIPVVLMSRDDFSEGPFSILLLSSLYGFCLLLSSDSFLTLFLGLELMSLPVYALVLLAFTRTQSIEAALKYLILGGTASALFLMGVALLYGATGSMAIGGFARALVSGELQAMAAVMLITIAFFLKAAIVPFHAWAPDAYEGASVPVTAYMATVIKAGVLLAAVRLFDLVTLSGAAVDLIAILPLISIVWGNLAAMRQTSFRRMIGYSSIAHAGYLFYAFLGAGETRFQAVLFYVIAYGVMNLLAFAALPRSSDDGSRDNIDLLRGLFQRRPYAAVIIALSMLSLAGLPPLPGFVAKFLIFRNVMEAGYTLYAVLGLVGSYVGIYFYLRVIRMMFMSGDVSVPAQTAPDRWAFSASAVCLAAALALSVFPGWFIGAL